MLPGHNPGRIAVAVGHKKVVVEVDPTDSAVRMAVVGCIDFEVPALGTETGDMETEIVVLVAAAQVGCNPTDLGDTETTIHMHLDFAAVQMGIAAEPESRDAVA